MRRVRALGAVFALGSSLLLWLEAPVEASVAPAGETIHIAVAGTDDALWVGPGGTVPFNSLGGVLATTPGVGLLQSSANQFVPFYVGIGLDGKPWARTGEAHWRRLSSNDGTICIDKPGVYTESRRTASGGFETDIWVACVGTDEAVYVASGRSAAGGVPVLNGWVNLGGEASNGVSVTRVGDQITFLVNGNAAAGEETVWTRTLGGAWSKTPWLCIDTPALGAAYGRAWFACWGAADDALWFAQHGGAQWGQAFSAGGEAAGPPAVAATSSGATIVTPGVDSAVWENFVPNAGAPAGWHRHGGAVPDGLGVAAVGTTPERT